MLPHQLMNVTRHVFKTNKKKLRSVKKNRKWININKTKKKLIISYENYVQIQYVQKKREKG